MSDSKQNVFDRLTSIYASGEVVPWDAKEPPPEVIEILSTIPAGKALDLGCGYGRAAIYMAHRGWEVDAIDFIPDAIAEAIRRAADAHVDVNFHLSRVTDLDFLDGGYDFGLDVGCCHNLNSSDLRIYYEHLVRLIRSGGTYMLFARMKDDSGDLSQISEEDPPGMDIDYLQELFREDFELEWKEHGTTQAGNDEMWLSAWFLFRRK